ncbi:MAG: AMP-binding protein [Vicinamibacterales bacterium]|nr:AMP-binding protein [Vicinamibacterales bacterium]
MQRDTLIDFFRDMASSHDPFLVFDDGYRRRSHTYDEVGRAARGFAARLHAAGIRKGNHVVFWGENRPEWIACYWGCLLIGAVAVPIDFRSSAEFVARVCRVVNARVVLLGEDIPPGGAATDFGGAARWPFADFDWHADGPWPEVAIARTDIAQVIFTSGATAEPKGVVVRHGNVLANVVPVEREVRKYRRYARPFHPLRFLNLLPLSHMFGQSMATNVPPMLDGTVVFTRSLNPHDILQLIHARRISVLVCVPKMLDVLREHVLRTWPDTAAANSAAAPSLTIPKRWWRYRRVHAAFGFKFWAFVVGAAPLPPDLEEFWRRLGFAVIQGYGLTETAPIVTLNHPFRTSKGSVGTPIGGVEIRIAEDGEILVRGENVTSGYFGGVEGARDADGWLHTGDIGEKDATGRLFIKGRKKEMIVTPEGLNVFPEDVEHALTTVAGVRDAAVVGIAQGTDERVHAVLVVDEGVDVEAAVREANGHLQDHQRIRGVSVWPEAELPRTDGTRKLKRREVRQWVLDGRRPEPVGPRADTFEALVARFTAGREVGDATTLEDLGLSSLERVELMVALEDRFHTRIDEGRFTGGLRVADLARLVEHPAEAPERAEPVTFPTWNRSWPVRVLRRLSLATWILPLARVFAHLRVEGLEHVQGLDGPVVFAANHQSHLDVPVILAALPGHVRARVAPAMAKEFFKAHFFPERHAWRERLTNSANYYLSTFFFNAFPLPQRETGARYTLQYIGELTGEGWSVLIFPEGVRSEDERIATFRGGIGMIGSRLDVPVVPVRLEGVNHVLHPRWKMARPGRVRVIFGSPMRLRGDDYPSLAADVERAVRNLR